MRKVVCVCLLVLITVFTVFADTSTGLHGGKTFGDFEYKVENNEVTITGFIGRGTFCEVPAEIEGFPVTKIGENAFTIWYMALTDIVVPETVTIIDKGAFYNCITLERVNIPSKVTSIGEHAFCKCLNMKSIKIPESVTSIGPGAFYFCSALTDITIPKGLTTIGENAFCGCSALKKITVASKNPSYTSKDGVLFNKDGTELIAYPAGKSGKYTIPNKVSKIAVGAFYGSSSLTEVKIPTSITEIPEQAFARCTSLKKVSIPATVTSIGQSAFEKCKSLASINIPASVTSISAYAFSECSTLNKVVLPVSLVKLSNCAFYYCISLTDITIPSTVIDIGDDLFPKDKVTVKCDKDSAIYNYCVANNIAIK